MKLSRKLTFAIGIAAFLMSFSILSYASAPCKHTEAHVKTLKDAATALKSSNPALAADLNKYAAEEENIVQKMRGKCEAAAKDFREAATALKASNPGLSMGLTDMADRKDRMARGEDVDWEKDLDADLKTLKDASAVLQPVNPDLAGRLDKIVAKKEAMKEWAKD